MKHNKGQIAFIILGILIVIVAFVIGLGFLDKFNHLGGRGFGCSGAFKDDITQCSLYNQCFDRLNKIKSDFPNAKCSQDACMVTPAPTSRDPDRVLGEFSCGKFYSGQIFG